MRTCNICKSKFEPNKYTKGVQIVCSVSCSYEYSKRQKEKAQTKAKKGLDKTREQDKTNRAKEYLKTEIQKLSRLIDARFNFGCCCCNKPIDGTGHGAHYHNKKGNENIMFNLHNINRSRAHCNMFSSEHKKGYREEMIRRYGQEYADYLEYDIRLIYKEMHFTSLEIKQALKTTRKLVKDFDTFQLTNPILTRDRFNTLIGLYKIEYYS